MEAVFADPTVLAGTYPLGKCPDIYDEEDCRENEAPLQVQEIWTPYQENGFVRSCVVCTNVAESRVTIANVGLVVSSGVRRRVSTDIRTGSTVNALQTLSKAQITQQQGRTGRTDEGDHITLVSHEQHVSQVRSTDLAQLEESDVSPMVLRSLVPGRSFARLPYLCPPHPVVQIHTKHKVFLHGVLDTQGVTRMGQTTVCVDLPCDWAQFLHVCAERGLEESAVILIAARYREGPAMTQQFNLNQMEIFSPAC